MTDAERIVNHLIGLEEGALTRQIIAKAVRAMLKTYIQKKHVKCAYDVGSGSCEDFAEAVREALGSPPGLDCIEYANLTGPIGCEECDNKFYPETLQAFGVKLPPDVDVDLLNKSGLGDSGTHIFIRWETPQGYLWFDAESPQGVDSPFDLPFAQRYLNIARLHNW